MQIRDTSHEVRATEIPAEHSTHDLEVDDLPFFDTAVELSGGRTCSHLSQGVRAYQLVWEKIWHRAQDRTKLIASRVCSLPRAVTLSREVRHVRAISRRRRAEEDDG